MSYDNRTRELVIIEEFKKVEIICGFVYVDYEFINSNIKSKKKKKNELQLVS